MNISRFRLNIDVKFGNVKTKNSYKKNCEIMLSVDETGTPTGSFWRRLYGQQAISGVEEVQSEDKTEEIKLEVKEDQKSILKKKKKKSKENDSEGVS